MGKQRLHVPVAKPGQLLVKWGRPEPGEAASLVYAYGAAGAARVDGAMLSHVFEGMRGSEGRTLIEELEHRGYDISTLSFSIAQRDQAQTG